MENCLFCKIFKGEIPSQKVFESATVIGFKDIAPQAKEHYLFIHKNHSENFHQMMQLSPQDCSETLKAIQTFVNQENLHTRGFRLVTNNGKSAGQSVFHTHFHLLSSEKLGTFGD